MSSRYHILNCPIHFVSNALKDVTMDLPNWTRLAAAAARAGGVGGVGGGGSAFSMQSMGSDYNVAYN